MAEERKHTSYIIANIAWNSSGWKGITEDKTNFRWTQIEGNIPHESWNFDFKNSRNTSDKIYGFAQFTHPPKKSGIDNFFIIFRSKDRQGKNKIVGFYGDAEILKEAKVLNEKASANVVANRKLCILLERAIDDSDNIFLFGKQKVGQIGFNLISKSNSMDIINEALRQNPSQSDDLNQVKSWLESTLPSNESNEKGAVEMSKSEELANLLEHTHNLILHGAPGTGKTHLARDIAKAMRCSDNEIGFVQFHPSYDYTDFVEGLRPMNDGNSGQIGFERKDGVFKKFCERALNNFTDGTKDNFEEAYGKLLDKIEESPESIIYKTSTYKKEFVVEITSLRNLSAIPQTETKTPMTITKENLRTYLRTGEILDWKPYVTVIGQHLIDEFGYKKIDAAENKKNFVFIIDEINRGEMSKIFGELFFAIEPDYRGAEKCKDLRTQYANLQTIPNSFDAVLGIKDSDNFGHFFIPENVYIIGTMNDIDRNVESMDFAFRRRFTFKEITAKDTQQDILAGLDDSIREDAIRRMNSLNDAISNIEGLSSAYHIGGAYFLKLKDLDNDFEKLWEYHLEGLLREYLRGMEDAESELKKLKETYENQSDNLGEQD